MNPAMLDMGSSDINGNNEKSRAGERRAGPGRTGTAVELLGNPRGTGGTCSKRS